MKVLGGSDDNQILISMLVLFFCCCCCCFFDLFFLHLEILSPCASTKKAAYWFTIYGLQSQFRSNNFESNRPVQWQQEAEGRQLWKWKTIKQYQRFCHLLVFYIYSNKAIFFGAFKVWSITKVFSPFRELRILVMY